ncbi:hypothetical protein ZWY2020_044042 [Hordeum vulgare]|nr:hypothetical protein ZWY2020_044042 [Hordeum vulgare]
MARVERLASARLLLLPRRRRRLRTGSAEVAEEVAQIQGLCAQMDRLWRSIPAKGERDLWKRAKVRESPVAPMTAGEQRSSVEAHQCEHQHLSAPASECDHGAGLSGNKVVFETTGACCYGVHEPKEKLAPPPLRCRHPQVPFFHLLLCPPVLPHLSVLRSNRRTEHNEEVVGEDICCAEMENAVFHTRDHLSLSLHQFPIEDNGCGQQPGFITQPIEQDVSDAEAHLHDNVEQKVMDHNFSSLDPIDQVCSHQRSLDDTSISDVNKCFVGNELPLSSVSRSCDDHTDNNEYRYPEVVQVNTLESIKHVEESSPINELNADVRCTLVVMQPDSCGSTDKICTSFEEVVHVPVEVQPDSLVCHDVKTKDILLHMNVEQAAIGYSFSDDKTLDLPHIANFGAQDGQLENVVCDALNNHVQQEYFETKTYVGVPDTVVILSPPTVANVSHDGHLLLANMDESSKDMNQQSGTMNVDICRSVDDQEPREAYVFQQKSFHPALTWRKLNVQYQIAPLILDCTVWSAFSQSIWGVEVV